MTSITIFPGRYIQGRDVLRRLGLECARLGDNVFIIASPHSREHLLPTALSEFPEGCRTVVETFGRQCSDEEIQRLLTICRAAGCNLVVGMGGGKALDTAKAVAHQAGVPSVMTPTLASTDAPCSAVCVVYTPEGVHLRGDILPRNPDVVLMDTSVVSQAPPRFLVSGMGDALATWFEAESCRMKRAPNMTGEVGSMTAYALARLCFETLMEYGLPALIACQAKAVTPALERIVEACTLLSGLGFESAGLAAAHALHNGFTALPETDHYYHGEKVAFGTLASLFLTDKSPALIDQTYDFCEAVGLPTRLADIGLTNVTDAELLKVAEKACDPEDTMGHEPHEVSPAMLVDAIKTADAMGRERRGA